MEGEGRKREAAGAGRGAGVLRRRVESWLTECLEPGRFRDYCPNGLQVEGAPRVAVVASGVTASLAFVRAAVRAGADTLLVHHGWFWRGEDPCVLGPKRERLALVLQHRLNLFAYHLPLDVHPTLGNNAQLGLRLGWRIDGRFGDEGLGCWHDLGAPQPLAALVASLGAELRRDPLVLGSARRRVRRVAWCTGAAQDMLAQAAAAGADLFLSGEVSERTTHLARELGVAYVAAGHHATERYGVQALGARLAAEFGLQHRFIDDPNPV
jgi:dinuclear metal center YbgI/SA1388 family protein